MAQHMGWGGGPANPGQGPGGPGPGGPGPGGPYGGPPPGWGGGPGWMPWGPPPAPKPGVIPLRPLALGDILGGAFAAIGRCWKALFGISLLAYGLALAITAAGMFLAYDSLKDRITALPDDPDQYQWSDWRPLILTLAGVWLLAVLAWLCAAATVAASCPAVLQNAVLGKPAAFGATLRRALSRLPAVLGTLLLTSLIVVVPALLVLGLFVWWVSTAVTSRNDTLMFLPGLMVLAWLALMPLMIWLWVRFSLAPAAAVFESAGPVRALRRSARLVRGSWWRIFGVMLLVHLIASMAAYLIQIPFSMLGMFSTVPSTSELGHTPTDAEILAALSGLFATLLLGALVAQLVTAVFPQLALGLQYVDQRIRKENLAPTLIEAAPPTPSGV